MKSLRRASAVFSALFLVVLLGIVLKTSKETLALVPEKFIELPGSIGTPPRLEREFKIEIHNSDSQYVFEILKQALHKLVFEKKLKAAEFLGQQYYFTFEPEAYIYKDIYFDTEERLNYMLGNAYRLRYRWKNFSDLQKYMAGSDDKDSFPIRVEIQAKTERVEGADGFSHVSESRLEFRDQSAPFHALNPAPPAPWPEHEYIHYVKTGYFQGMPIKPMVEILRSFAKAGYADKKIQIAPSAIVYSRRTRLHLNVETPWGSGPNPNQAYIITLDSVFVSKPELHLPRGTGDILDHRLPWLDFVSEYMVTEMEIEFERNVSTITDQQTNLSGKEGNRARKAQELFLADLKVIVEQLKSELSQNRVPHGSSNVSKYRKVIDFLENRKQAKNE